MACKGGQGVVDDTNGTQRELLERKRKEIDKEYSQGQ